MGLPVGCEKFFASLQTQTCVPRANNSVTEGDLVLPRDLADNLFQIVIFSLLGALPGCKVAMFTVVAVWRVGRGSEIVHNRLRKDNGQTDHWPATFSGE